MGTLPSGLPDRRHVSGKTQSIVTAKVKALERNRDTGSTRAPGKTTVGAYSVRGLSRPTVSTPVTWKEVRGCLKSGDPATLEFVTSDVVARVKKSGDLFAF